MSEFDPIETLLEGVHLQALSPQDDIQLHLGRRPEYHSLPPDEEGAPDWFEYIQRRFWEDLEPKAVVKGVWHRDKIVGETALLPLRQNLSVAEVTCRISPGQQNRGYGKAAVIAIAELGLKDLGFKTIVAKVKVANTISQRLVTASGFQYQKLEDARGGIEKIYRYGV